MFKGICILTKTREIGEQKTGFLYQSKEDDLNNKNFFVYCIAWFDQKIFKQEGYTWIEC